MLLIKNHRRWIMFSLLASLGLFMAASIAHAENGYLTTWNSLYPLSTSGAVASCKICHAASNSNLNPYGKAVCDQSGSTSARIIAVENVDSDADPTGSNNVIEIDANAQPGWTTTAVPTYARGNCQATGNTETAPTTISGLLDPVLFSVKNDFNGDEISDVLLRNQLDGSWQMNLMDTTGSGMVAQTFETNLNKNSNVELAGYGDFNGDGFNDVLTRNSIWGIWQVNLMDASGNGMVASTFETNLNKNSNVVLAGIGDFNGDGFDDVLTRNSIWGIWQVNLMDASGNGMVASTFETNLNKNSNVVLAGIGDFNGDGFDDVLTRNSIWGIWQVNLMDASGNGMVASTFETNLNKNSNVVLAGIGDFNGDGFDDVLTRNSIWGIWQVNLMDVSGSGMVAQTIETNLNKNLNVEMNRIGDFNGDGFDDVLTRNSIWGIWQVNLMDASGNGMVASTFETNLDKDTNLQ